MSVWARAPCTNSTLEIHGLASTRLILRQNGQLLFNGKEAEFGGNETEQAQLELRKSSEEEAE